GLRLGEEGRLHEIEVIEEADPRDAGKEVDPPQEEQPAFVTRQRHTVPPCACGSSAGADGAPACRPETGPAIARAAAKSIRAGPSGQCQPRPGGAVATSPGCPLRVGPEPSCAVSSQLTPAAHLDPCHRVNFPRGAAALVILVRRVKEQPSG